MTTETSLTYLALIATDVYGPVRITETIAAGADLVAGTILGRVTMAAGAVVADAGNTGNGAVSGVALGSKTHLGDYVLTCTVAALGGGVFAVVAPDGCALPDATVGVAYANQQINFTVAAGAADFVVGDKITIPAEAGNQKIAAYAAASVDGSQNPIGVLLEDAAAAVADVEASCGFAGVWVEDNITGLDAAAKAALEGRAVYFK